MWGGEGENELTYPQSHTSIPCGQRAYSSLLVCVVCVSVQDTLVHRFIYSGLSAVCGAHHNLNQQLSHPWCPTVDAPLPPTSCPLSLWKSSLSRSSPSPIFFPSVSWFFIAPCLWAHWQEWGRQKHRHSLSAETFCGNTSSHLTSSKIFKFLAFNYSKPFIVRAQLMCFQA